MARNDFGLAILEAETMQKRDQSRAAFVRDTEMHFVPSYCPHLNPIERLWALMHEHLTHNKTYPTCREFADAILAFLRDEVPRRWGEFCDSVTDNFRVILPAKFRILA